MKNATRLFVGVLIALTSLGASPPQQDEQVRFVPYDLLIDSGEERLAAWQVRIEDTTGRAKIVGIENLDWKADVYHDPKALMSETIVLASFSLDGELSTGRLRAVRLHLRVAGAGEPAFTALVEAAASDSEDPITANALLER